MFLPGAESIFRVGGGGAEIYSAEAEMFLYSSQIFCPWGITAKWGAEKHII